MSHGIPAWVGVWCGLLPLTALSAEALPTELEGVGIEEHLGTQLPLDLRFTDESGASVTLRQYFAAGKPVVVALLYYGCPSLCGLVQNGILAAYRELGWSVGKEFTYVAISIDPTETPALAREKKTAYLAEYGRPGAEAGWHFLVGTPPAIEEITRTIGFRYRYDEQQQQYAHAAAMYVATPDGRLSRYLYGIQFRPMDLKLALVEAGQGRIGSVLDRLLLFCYHYDPQGKRYAVFATRLMRAGGAVTVVGLGLMVWGLQRAKRRRREKE